MWLLSSLLFTTARAFSASKQSSDVPDTPTCEQLRAAWEELSRVVKAEQITNEIPLIPLQGNPTVDRILTTSRKKQHRKPNRKILKNSSSNLFDAKDSIKVPASPNNLAPSKPQTSSGENVDGVFGEFHEQAADQPPNSEQQRAGPEVIVLGSPSLVPSGNTKMFETEYYIPQWGLPEDVDTFGSFVDFDIEYPTFAMSRTPKGGSRKWSDISKEAAGQESSQFQTCDILLNSDCRRNEECTCTGRKKLVCMRGRCLNQDHEKDIGRKYGVWHNKPVSQSQLQTLARLRKRGFKSIFM